jgi:hypothetical protein
MRSMGKFEKLASAGYLDKTRERSARRSISSEEYQDLEKKMSSRLTDQPWEKEGSMRFSIKGEGEDALPTSFSIEYDSESTPELEKYRHQIRGWTPDDDMDDMVTINMGTFRRIKDLRIEHAGNKFDMRAAVRNLDVYTYIGNEPRKQVIIKGQHGVYGLRSRHAEIIFTTFDPTSIFGLMVLLHEIGHEVKESAYTIKESGFKKQSGAKIENGEATTVAEKVSLIENERSADAFALHTLYRLMGKNVDMTKINKIFHSGQSGAQGRLKWSPDAKL